MLVAKIAGLRMLGPSRREEGDDIVEESADSEDEDAENGHRKTKHMHDPMLPSAAEVREHQLTHLPYRSWCHHCVRGRGKEMNHECRKDCGQGVAEYHLDYCFPGDENGQKLTILVVVEKFTKMKKAVVVPSKGSTGRFAARKVLDLINECGDKDRTVILKTDQEPAIKFLVDDVCMARTGARTIVEQAPVRSKGSNGVVERAVQTVEQYFRTLKSQLDERYGVRIDTKHPVLTWLCEYSMHMLNRLEVSKDGKTAYERCKGKQAKVLGLEFAEKVLWKFRQHGAHMEKLNGRWGHGLFIGVRQKSGELIVVDSETKAIKYVRTARRIPEEERWQVENLEWVQRVPWNTGADDAEADGEVPEFDFKQGPGTRLTEGEMEEIRARENPRIVHRAHLRKADFDKYGYTDRCGGCSAILRGLRAQPHAEHCRRRMENHLEEDVRVKNAKVRLGERSRKLQNDGVTGSQDLKDIEEAAMNEDDPAKLNALFQEYREMYMKEREAKSEGEQKKRKLQNIEDELMETDDGTRADELYQEYMREYKKEPMQEMASSSRDGANYAEPGMDIDQVLVGEPGDYAWDDVNNMELPMEAVREARKEEITYMKNKTFKVVKKAEAYERTGKAPISTKWVDTDKSHGVGELRVRSRWVARDFKTRGEKDREDLFCATPPLELLRFLLSRQATRRRDGKERKTMFTDVKKAHLVPECHEEVYVELPEEAEVEKDECGKLLRWLYGCRRAGQAWEDHYSGVLANVGFKRAMSSPVAFYHPGRDLWAVVHGDDFVFTGVDDDLDFVLQELVRHYEIKNRGRLGSGLKDAQEIDILGRVVKLHKWGVSWEADARHRQIIMGHFGLDEVSKTLIKNGYKEEIETEGETKNEELSLEDQRTYRALAARINYIAQDNPCIQFSAKEICRSMAKPVLQDFQKVKKLARFMAGVKAVKFNYEWQSEDEAVELRVFVDSDWAGCVQTRRSTSGGVVMLGRHTLKTWSTTQPTIALSSAEAELYAMTEGATRGMGLRTMLDEMGVYIKTLHLYTDASAAKSFASRRGLGKMRHVEVKELWLQAAVKEAKVKLHKVDGEMNPADLLTKYMDLVRLRRLGELLGLQVF